LTPGEVDQVRLLALQLEDLANDVFALCAELTASDPGGAEGADNCEPGGKVTEIYRVLRVLGGRVDDGVHAPGNPSRVVLALSLSRPAQDGQRNRRSWSDRRARRQLRADGVREYVVQPVGFGKRVLDGLTGFAGALFEGRDQPILDHASDELCLVLVDATWRGRS